MSQASRNPSSGPRQQMEPPVPCEVLPAARESACDAGSLELMILPSGLRSAASRQSGRVVGEFQTSPDAYSRLHFRRPFPTVDPLAEWRKRSAHTPTGVVNLGRPAGRLGSSPGRTPASPHRSRLEAGWAPCAHPASTPQWTILELPLGPALRT